MVERFVTPDHRAIPIAELVGECVVFNPRKMLNQKRLFATQDWVDTEKAARALNGLGEDLLPAVHLLDITNTRGRQERIIVVGDGTHRIGVACMDCDDICAQVIGEWDTRLKKYGFNLIIQQLHFLIGNCI